MQFNWLSYFTPTWKIFLERPKIHKHNILKKPFEKKKQIKVKYNFGATASKMEFFVTIVNGWKLRAIDTRRFVLDAAGVLDPLR